MSGVHHPNMVCTVTVFSNPPQLTRQIHIKNTEEREINEVQLIEFLYKWAGIALRQLEVNNNEKEYPAVQISLCQNKAKSEYIFSVYSENNESPIDNEALAMSARSFCLGFFNEVNIQPPKEEA